MLRIYVLVVGLVLCYVYLYTGRSALCNVLCTLVGLVLCNGYMYPARASVMLRVYVLR